MLTAQYLLSYMHYIFIIIFCTYDDLMICYIFLVLDFAIQVLRKGAAADDIISSFIIFSVQYIMVNHMNWKYKSYSRWKITLKVHIFLICLIVCEVTTLFVRSHWLHMVLPPFCWSKSMVWKINYVSLNLFKR